MSIEFINLIKEGELPKIQQYYNDHPNINISAKKECAFRSACEYGYLKVAKWLLEIKPDIDISADYEYAFCFACANGHLEVVKWLLEVKPNIDIRIDYNYAFRYACRNGHLEIAKILHSINPDIDNLIDEFEISKINQFGHDEVFEWLKSR